MNIGLHTLSGGQNATYTFEALVDGKWEQFLVLKDDQAIPTDTKYADYNAVMNDANASVRVNATLYHTLEEPITTNNIRVTVSDYAKNYMGGDVLIFPFVYELELFGKKGYTPDIILPEGASYTTDIAWHSYPSAKTVLTVHTRYLLLMEISILIGKLLILKVTSILPLCLIKSTILVQ